MFDDCVDLRNRAQFRSCTSYGFDTAADLPRQFGGAAFAGIKQNQDFGHAR
jgi:hypothetical protein